jgi:hypothetical protein
MHHQDSREGRSSTDPGMEPLRTISAKILSETNDADSRTTSVAELATSPREPWVDLVKTSRYLRRLGISDEDKGAWGTKLQSRDMQAGE